MTRRRTPATMTLLGLILLGFGYEVMIGAWKDPFVLAMNGSIVPPLIWDYGQYWRLITAMFLHGDGTPQGTLLHLFVNLLSLYNIGRIFELMFGSRRFVVIYFLAGIAASVTSAMHIEGSSVGASGAIFGILGALVSSILRSPRLRSDKMARSIVNQCVFWMVANIAIGFSIPQIDNAAHIGGLIAGLILGAVVPQRTPPPPPPAEVVVDVRPYEVPGEGPAARTDDRSPRG